MKHGMTVQALRLFLRDVSDDAIVVLSAELDIGLGTVLEPHASALHRCETGRFDTFGSQGFMSDELTSVDENPRKIVAAVCLFSKET